MRLPVGERCPVCAKTRQGVDPCIGTTLSGVRGSCCGHGEPETAYVILDDRTPDESDCVRLHGECAAIYFRQRLGHEIGKAA